MERTLEEYAEMLSGMKKDADRYQNLYITYRGKAVDKLNEIAFLEFQIKQAKKEGKNSFDSSSFLVG